MEVPSTYFISYIDRARHPTRAAVSSIGIKGDFMIPCSFHTVSLIILICAASFVDMRISEAYGYINFILQR
jgi:3-polyprenyl-4-hydroxybenzoate decarboxylase